MRSKKLRILSIAFLAFLAFLVATPTDAFAVMQSLNGQTGSTQTFQNDSNVTISSSGNTHTFGWAGQLPISRGGTGASSFTNGSIPFISNGIFSQNNSKFFWDNVNNRLGIGISSPTQTLEVNGSVAIANTTNNYAGDHDIFFGGGQTNTGHIYGLNAPNGSLMDGSSIAIIAGVGDNYLSGGHVEVNGGYGGSGGGNGGRLELSGGDATGGNGSGGNVEFRTGLKVGSGTYGVYKFFDPSQSNAGVLDFSLINSSNKTFTFPNVSGTFGLIEGDQTWNGLNKFEASSNSTIYVGSSTKTSCIALGDSDGSGITYVTVNDGVMTASTTKPSFCQ